MTGWTTVKLGDVLTRVERFEERDEWTEYPFAGTYSFARGIFVGEKKTGASFKLPKIQRIKAGDFVYCKIMAWEGAFGLVPEKADDCVMSGAFVAYEIDNSRLDPSFLDLYFKIPQNWKNLGGQSSGTNVRRQSLHPAQFEAHEIPLPSLPEQRRIVARIEALAAEIDEAKRLRREAVEEAGALVERTLESTMLPHGPSWTRATVDAVIETMDAGWSPQCEDAPASSNEWGVLKTTAVQWCDFQAFHNKRLPSTLHPRPELAVQAGDVLVTRAGPRKRVGVVATVRETFPTLTISDKLIRLRLRPEVDPRFLEYSLCSPFSQEFLVQRKTGLADAQVNISQKILRETPVAYPPLPEQRRIVAELDALQAEVDALKRLQSETAAELDALLPAILDRAFKGEL